MNTTYVIAQAALNIALNDEPYGWFDVWEDSYRLLIYYDCAFDLVEIQLVEKGVYLSNNLVLDYLPDDFDEECFHKAMLPILKKRYDEIKKEKEMEESFNYEERERDRREQEAADWEHTIEYLNRTFGLY